MKNTLKKSLAIIFCISLIATLFVFPANADGATEDYIVKQEWSFEGKSLNDPDVNVRTNSYWDGMCNVVRTVADGKYTLSHEEGDENGYLNAPLRVYFKLSEDLVPGNKYILSINMYSPEAGTIEAGSAVYYAVNADHNDNMDINTSTHPLVPTAANAIGTITKADSYNLSSSENGMVDYEFTAAEGMVAGGYIGFAAKLGYKSKSTYIVKGATLKLEPYSVVANYNTANEADRNALKKNMSLDSTGGTSHLFKYGTQAFVGITGFELEQLKRYKIDLNIVISWWGDGDVQAYAFPENAQFTDTRNGIKIADLGAINTANNNTTPKTFSFDLSTENCAIDFEQYPVLTLVINSNSGSANKNIRFFGVKVSRYNGTITPPEPEKEKIYLDDNGNIVAGNWSFEGKTFKDPDINVITDSSWDNSCCAVRTIQDGKYTVSNNGAGNYWNAPLRVYFKLAKDLVAGKTYTLKMNMYSPEGGYIESGSTVFYNDTAWQDQNISIGVNENHPLYPATAIVGTTKSSSFALETDENSVVEYEFTATEDMVAGGYIGFAAKLTGNRTYVVKGATLIGDNTVNMVNYDMDIDINAGENATFIHTATHGDSSYGATNSEGSAASGVDAEIMGGKSVLKKYQYQLIMAVPTVDLNGEDNCVVLEADKQYSVKLKAACGYDGGSVYFYAGNPDDFDSDGGTNPENGCISYEIAHFDGVTANVDTPATYTYKFATTGMNIDFNTYNQLCVVIRPYDSSKGNVTHCYSLSVSSFAEKGLRFNNAVKLEKARYNKIVLAENSYATYAIKDNTSGEYTELEDNNAFLLDPDTSYTFKVKYADDGLFLDEDYGEEYTFKTLKFGDVNADNNVNIIDIVALKKGIANTSEDDIFDLTDDDLRDGNDLTVLVNTILGIEE